MLRRFRWLNVVVLVALTLAVVGGGSVWAAPGRQVEVRLAVDQAAFAADQSVLVHVSISNPNQQPIKVLKWYTSADEVAAPLFTVKLNGAPVAYQGAIFKRPAPTSADYVTLKAGESLSFDVDLAAYYDFSASGQYEISYEVSSVNLFAEKSSVDDKRADSLVSNNITVWVEGRLAKDAAEAAPAVEAVSGSTTFNKCTTSQQSSLLTARTEASNYAANARSYLQAGTVGSRYTTWFGTYTSSRYGTVTSHFNAIGSAMDTASVKFDCSCKQSAYAYVYPNRPYTIYLCKAFWSAPMRGTDSKAGTLIHEMSHFYVVASTDDYVYGQTGAKNLAKSNPAQAVDNADNHEYFAENNPALP
ncbi:MAG TPA: M35 family metallo-endopeptidase [Anaerolineae bacterium]|nr:M35 family metallo-endopeptidase [Anaerolineae bacterium]